MRFGVHVSIAGKIYEAIDRAVARGCETMQIFSGSPRNWKKLEITGKDMEEFRRRRKKANIYPVVLHLPYLTNLGSSSAKIHSGSLELMKEAVKRARELDASYVVFHVGSHRGSGIKQGLERVILILKKFFAENKPDCHILLENTSGSGTTLGSTFSELGFILTGVKEPLLGVCFDTAHAFAAGYDIASPSGLEETLEEFEEEIGLEKLKLLHANDSKSSCGSRVDRHEDIGKGYIGLDGFQRIVNHPCFKDLPCILETPGMDKERDIKNLETIRSLIEKE